MKGAVFKAFEAFIEERWSEDLIDSTLNLEGLSTGGAYTSVGNYPHSDMLTMAVHVADQTGTPVNTLVREFGEYLFHILASAHAEMVAGFSSCVDMLSGIESVIHRDVRKLYSNTELPQFDVEDRDGDRSVKLVYKSTRPFADLAEGLILGAFEHYGVKANSALSRYDHAPDGTHAAFTIMVNNDNRQNPS
ncbi:MAG: heme NO-binding domain-containing protein [Pseudomonadota bacterium]